MAYIPDRGEFVWLDMSPQAGHEQAGRRPALILSPRDYNERVGLALCCPVTSQIKGFPYEVQIPPGLTVSGVVLSDQVRSMDLRARRAEYLSQAPDTVLTEVSEKLGTLLR